MYVKFLFVFHCWYGYELYCLIMIRWSFSYQTISDFQSLCYFFLTYLLTNLQEYIHNTLWCFGITSVCLPLIQIRVLIYKPWNFFNDLVYIYPLHFITNFNRKYFLLMFWVFHLLILYLCIPVRISLPGFYWFYFLPKVQESWYI